MAFVAFRTALDRTTLAWIRTALTFETFGLGMIGFFRALNQSAHNERSERLHQFAIHFGVLLVAIGMLALLFSTLSHARALRRLRRSEPPPLLIMPLSIAIGSFVALLCLYALWWTIKS
jgi:uncharacterized membrane protein YidH (DUF202 family)